jgi:hypothetical protein
VQSEGNGLSIERAHVDFNSEQTLAVTTNPEGQERVFCLGLPLLFGQIPELYHKTIDSLVEVSSHGVWHVVR